MRPTTPMTQVQCTVYVAILPALEAAGDTARGEPGARDREITSMIIGAIELSATWALAEPACWRTVLIDGGVDVDIDGWWRQELQADA